MDAPPSPKIEIPSKPLPSGTFEMLVTFTCNVWHSFLQNTRGKCGDSAYESFKQGGSAKLGVVYYMDLLSLHSYGFLRLCNFKNGSFMTRYGIIYEEFAIILYVHRCLLLFLRLEKYKCSEI